MGEKRPLDHDGLDGILSNTTPKPIPKRSHYTALWALPIVFALIAGTWLIKNVPQPEPKPQVENASAPAPTASPAPSQQADANMPTAETVAPMANNAGQAVTPALENNTEAASPAPLPTQAAPAKAENTSTASTELTTTKNTDAPLASSQNTLQTPDPSVPNEPEKAIEEKAKPASTAFTVYFRFDSVKPNKLSASKLKQLIKQAKACPGQIILTGHTCNIGTAPSNQQLGLARAKVVKHLLIHSGIPANRIVTASAGTSQPIADNNTWSGQLLNRRTELSCLGQ